MKADPQTAKKLEELVKKATVERQQLEDMVSELTDSKGVSVGKIGIQALKTASSIGLRDPKTIIEGARLVVLPAVLGLGRFLLKHGSPRRAVGLALLVGGAVGVFQGVKYDDRKKQLDQERKSCTLAAGGASRDCVKR